MSQLDSYELDEVFGCMIWNGKLDGRGESGVVWRNGKPIQAHRAAWEAAHGPIAEGLVIDHLCRRPLCINVEHLEPVTQNVNLYRRKWSTRVRQAKCKRGHDLKLHAMVTNEGGRVCRECMKETRT